MNDSIRWEPVEDGEYDMGIAEYPLYIFGNTDPDVCTHVELYDEEVMLDLGMKICIAKPAPTLEMPEGEGYFSFEGRLDGSSVEKLQWLVMVRRNSIDGSLYVYRFGGQTFKVSQMFGTWTRVYMPWEQRPGEEVA